MQSRHVSNYFPFSYPPAVTGPLLGPMFASIIKSATLPDPCSCCVHVFLLELGGLNKKTGQGVQVACSRVDRCYSRDQINQPSLGV